MFKIQILKTSAWQITRDLVLNFGDSDFGFVSDFDIRISNFQVG